jgi:UDP-N-acetyl-2-amino-2-deoxyglucuronate dehydrogenase
LPSQMSYMQKIKFGIIGCGHIGKRHAAVIENDSNAELVALCDIDRIAVKDLADDYSIQNIFEDYRDLLQLNLDIVDICTPHYLHKQMTVDALTLSNNVLVEKPMALTAEDAREMIETSRKTGFKLFVVKQNRYNVPIILAGKALSEGKLGKISMVQCNVFWNRHQGYYDQSEWRGKKDKEGGALFTQASHFIDLLVHWFGPVVNAKTEIDTQFHDIEVEDAGLSSIVFKSGVLGSISWTTNVYNKNFEGSITIIGENGTIKIGGAYLNKIEFWDVQHYPLPDNISFVDKPNNYGKYQGSSSNHHRVIEEVIKNLNGDSADIVEGKEGELSISAIETIYNAAK